MFLSFFYMTSELWILDERHKHDKPVKQNKSILQSIYRNIITLITYIPMHHKAETGNYSRNR